MNHMNGIIGETYLDLSGWCKGQAFVSSRAFKKAHIELINAGRYWPRAGPQLALYHPFTHKGSNTIVLLELEGNHDSVLLTTERRYGKDTSNGQCSNVI